MWISVFVGFCVLNVLTCRVLCGVRNVLNDIYWVQLRLLMQRRGGKIWGNLGSNTSVNKPVEYADNKPNVCRHIIYLAHIHAIGLH